MLLEAAEAALPQWFKDAQIARSYNALTGAGLNHFDIAQLSLFERSEVLGVINNADLIG